MELPNDLVLFDAADGVARIRTMAEQMGRERTAFRETSHTADFAEGTRAFVEKRRAKFAGR